MCSPWHFLRGIPSLLTQDVRSETPSDCIIATSIHAWSRVKRSLPTVVVQPAKGSQGSDEALRQRISKIPLPRLTTFRSSRRQVFLCG